MHAWFLLVLQHALGLLAGNQNIDVLCDVKGLYNVWALLTVSRLLSQGGAKQRVKPLVATITDEHQVILIWVVTDLTS